MRCSPPRGRLSVWRTGWRTNWQVLARLGGLLGLAEGSANSAGMKETAEGFLARERELGGGVYNIDASFGSMLAPPLVWAILQYNWQAAVIMTAALGLVVCVGNTFPSDSTHSR